jgi:tRNA:m4X modification enzyme
VPIIATAKHLCGGATDLSIASLIINKENKAACNLRGISIATCCHHRCDLKTYVNPGYLTGKGDKELGLSELEILFLIKLSSYCTSVATKFGPEEIKQRILGYKAKRLIDYGRILYVR